MDYDLEIKFPEKMARLMALVASGEHPLLIAGSAGCGKTTLVEHLATLLNLPDENQFKESQKYWITQGRELKTRPIVQPHHSASPLAIVGGGRPLRFGEISLAHGGALILDELLEFHPSVQSALREPMEKGKIYLSRAGHRKTFPADFLVLATTNLCPCGNFKPGKTYRCRCSSLKLRNYIEKLTGPFLDRFSIFHLYKEDSVDLKTPLSVIKESIQRATEFRKKRNQSKMNQKLSMSDLKEHLKKDLLEGLIPRSSSHRRHLALFRVARTLADLEESAEISSHHLEEAQAWTASDIYKIERFSMDDFAAR